MKAVWVITAMLGLIYLAIYSGMKADDKPAPPPPTPAQATPEAGDAQGLAAIAQGDATGRVDSKAIVKVVSIKPKYLGGNPLAEVNPGTPGGQIGSLIEIGAYVDDQEISRLTYYAVPPNTVQFVKQETKNVR